MKTDIILIIKKKEDIIYLCGCNGYTRNNKREVLKMTFDKKSILLQIAVVAFIIAIMWVLMRANRLVFREVRKKQEGLHLLFFERINKALFAAQDVIKDVLGGMMISIYKPFEIGNRIELGDGTIGIIQDITMRHVVLACMEMQKVIIPNSRLNAMCIKNYSYHTNYRSAKFSFHIAYGSDVDKAIRVIKQAVKESQYSIPGFTTKKGKDYGDVYFMAYEDSSLKLVTTVYYKSTSPSEVVISDINLRVNHALAENGIEIPFTYINVIQKKN